MSRLRYGRLVAFGSAVFVTFVTMLGGLGLLPSGAAASYAATGSGDTGDTGDTAALQSSETGDAETEEDTDGDTDGDTAGASGRQLDEPTSTVEGNETGEPPVPADSGVGKRVVFSISQQRVWLVKEDETVKRTYLVSGSIYDNLAPGIYQVFWRSMHATGVDDSGTMRYMVRFAHGANAAIGFHDIPIDDGKRVQTRDELGTPLSHGCVRQWRPDAKALWKFAPVGTEVDVQA